jgi:RsbT co-antagonist protein rsbRD N-terminal domain
MTLLDMLTNKKASILDAWLRRALGTYSPQAAGRMKSKGDPFQNPVGSNLREGLSILLDGLLAGTSAEDLTAGLDPIVRIRAVQDFTPSDAVGFLFDIKSIVREFAESEHVDDLVALETAVDRLALRGFDLYMTCREKVFEIRMNEIRNRTHLALKQAGMLEASPDPEPDCGPGCDTERGQ